MDNAPLGWMPKQKFLKILYLDIYFFNIYINDLPDNLTSNSYLFADDTLLFPQHPNATANQINNDLHNIGTWAHQWKMNFNSDTSKQAKEVLFSRKGYYSIIQYMKPQLKSGTFLDMLQINKTIGLLRHL